MSIDEEKLTKAARDLASVNGSNDIPGALNVLKNAQGRSNKIVIPGSDLIIPPGVKEEVKANQKKNDLELKFKFAKKKREPGFHIVKSDDLFPLGSDYSGTTLCGRKLIFNSIKGLGTQGKYCHHCYRILKKLQERLEESFST